MEVLNPERGLLAVPAGLAPGPARGESNPVVSDGGGLDPSADGESSPDSWISDSVGS